MPAELKFHASLARYAPAEAAAYPVGPGRTVRDILTELAVPGEEVAAIVLNGRAAEPDDMVRDGDRLALVPAIGGG